MGSPLSSQDHLTKTCTWMDAWNSLWYRREASICIRKQLLGTAIMIWADEVGPNLIEINKAMEVLWTSWKWSACLDFNWGSKSHLHTGSLCQTHGSQGNGELQPFGQNLATKNSFPNEKVSNLGKNPHRKEPGISSNFRELHVLGSKPTKRWMIQG